MILKFHSPTILNEAKEVIQGDKPLWIHAEFKGFDNGALELDTITWRISCSEKNINEAINEWMVDEENHTMKLKTENIEGNFKPLDYNFAVSMLGQVLQPNKLVEYLDALQKIYQVIPPPESDEEKEEK